MRTKKTFLIILNWNQGEMTLRCLESVIKVLEAGSGNEKREIVVVDNGSNDDSIKKINEFRKLKNLKEKSANSLTIKLIENKENLGYAEGNNIGIKYALENGADYICLLNNDTRVSPSFLTELIRAAESDEKIGVVGGKIYFEKGYEFHKERYKPADLGKVIWYAGGIIDWKNVYAKHRGVDEVDDGRYETETETEYVNGCLMLVKKEVFEKAGLLDKKYFAYFEETDFCQKALKSGYKLFYTSKSIIWHLNAASSGSGSNLHDYFLTRNRLLFGIRWAPLRSKIALVRESLTMIIKGRKWQKIGVRDFYLGKFGKGSWNNQK